jgi:hypothetical protein
MNSTPLRLTTVLAALFLLSAAAANSHAVGSPHTRLIALGINQLSAAPFTQGQLFEINKQTGAATPFPGGFIFEFDHLGFNLAANSAGELFNAVGGLFARVNQLTFAGTVANFVPLSDGTQYGPFVHGIDFDSQNRLFGVLVNGAPNVDAVPYLAQINLASGLATTGPLVGGGLLNMAFDQQDNLFALSVQGLIQINTTTGQVTPIGGDLWTSGGRAIAFDGDGTLLAATDRLVVVNPATGNTTPVGAMDFAPYSIVGMAVIPIPEPGAVGLFGFTFIVLRTAKRASSTVAERRLS